MANIINKEKPKLRPTTVEEIELAIADLYNWTRCIIVPNVKSPVWHEMDIAVVQPSGYLYEIEIKRTIADFRADAKKRHGHKDRKNRIVEFYYAVPEEIWERIHFSIMETDIGLIVVKKWEEGEVRATIQRPAIRRKGAKKLTPAEQLKIAHSGAMRIWGLKAKVDKKNLNRKIFTDAVSSATRGRLIKLKKKIKELSSSGRFDNWDKISPLNHDEYLIETIRDDMIRSLK